MKKRVLIVDDDPIQRDGLVRMLRHKSIHAESAADFAAGVACAAEARAINVPFDLVLCDLGLPDMGKGDPFHTLANVHKFEAKVMAITGWEDPALIGEFQKRAMPFILKGTPMAAVLKTVLTELEWQQPSEPIARAIIDAHQEVKTLVPKTQVAGWRENVKLACTALAAIAILFAGATTGYSLIRRGGGNSTAQETRLIEIEKEPGRRADADKAFLESLRDLRTSLSALDDRLRVNDTRDQKSEDDRAAIHTTVDGIKTQMAADKSYYDARLTRIDDKLDRVLEALGAVKRR